jgi:hypothetical protein
MLDWSIRTPDSSVVEIVKSWSDAAMSGTVISYCTIVRVYGRISRAPGFVSVYVNEVSMTNYIEHWMPNLSCT